MRSVVACLAAVLALPPAPVWAQIRVLAPVAPVSGAPVPVLTTVVAAPLSPTIMNPLQSPSPSLAAPALAPALVPSAAASVPALAAAPAPAAEAAPVAARPALEALGASLSAPNAAPAAALDLRFGAAAPRCAACAGEEVPASALPSGGAPAQPPAAGRLPAGVKPSRYDLRLALEPEAGTFRGRAKVGVSVAKPTDRLVLHALDLDFSAVTVNGRRLDPSKVVVDAKA